MTTFHRTTDTLDVTPAAGMEAEECALIQDEREADILNTAKIAHEHSIARAADQPDMDTQTPIQPHVALHTDALSVCHEPTTADEMDAEERDWVIENSVDDVRTYADKPLSDAEIRHQALTEEAQIDPNPKDATQC